MKEKGDECIFVGYSTQSRAYRVFNNRTRVIMESIHVKFDELPHMASDHVISDPTPECQRMALEQVSLSPVIQRQENVPQADRTVSTSNELDLLFSLMFDELLNGTSKVVSKSFAVSAADASNQCQHHTTPLNNHTTPASTCQAPSLAPMSHFLRTFIKQKRMQKMIKLQMTSLSTSFVPQNKTEGRRRHVITRHQLESDAAMCMFALTVSQTEPKNIKEAMADSTWIESMQEELHQFDRLDVWELVDRPLCKNIINLSGSEKTNVMKRILLFETNIVWWQKDMRKRKELILKNLSHPLLGWNLRYMDSNKLQGHGTMNSPNSCYPKDFLKIHQSPHGIFINQAKYAQEILLKHGMTSCDSIGTPMATKHLDADLSGTLIDQMKYQSMVGALMYLTASRQDIVHATCYCARYKQTD
nr:uncharacterized mitochondrial protein AtMg00810-like [Tanacetum cinerariifolium]